MKTLKKEIENEFFLYENFLRKDYFELAVAEKKSYFSKKYPAPEYEVLERRNKHGVRIVVNKKETK